MEENRFDATVSTTNSSLTGMGLNPGLSGEMLVTDHLCHNRRLSCLSSVTYSFELACKEMCAVP
jgi:hypothetical protein